MSNLISITENGFHLVFEISSENQVLLLHCAAFPFDGLRISADGRRNGYRMVQVQQTGMDQNDIRGERHIGTCPGTLLTYRNHRDERNGFGRIVSIEQERDGLIVASHFQFFDGISVVRCWTELRNTGRGLGRTHGITRPSRATSLPLR